MARAAYLLSQLPREEAECVVARIEAKAAAKRRPWWRRALDRLTGRSAPAVVTSVPGAVVLPLDPAGDAELFRLFGKWQSLSRDCDAATKAENFDLEDELSDRISDLRTQMNVIQATTAPGLRLKLIFAWMRRVASYELETAMIYGDQIPPIAWTTDGAETKAFKPEFDPEWSLIRDLCRLLGVSVAPDLADDLLIDPVVALHARWKKAHTAYLEARDRLDSTTTGRDDLEREAHRLLGEEGAIVEAMLKVQPTTPAGIAALIEVGMRNAPIDTGFESDWPWPFFAAAQKAAESMKVGEAVHA